MSSPKSPKTVTIKTNTSSTARTATTKPNLEAELVNVLQAFEALKDSINKLADSGAEEEVKAKFVQFEEEHLWTSICGRDARDFANKTMQLLVDSADDSIDGVITVLDSLQKLFDMRHGAYICVEVGYLNNKLSLLIAYSVEQFRAMWSHFWDPRVKLTIKAKGKLMDVFYRHVCYLKRFFRSPLAAHVTTEQLVDLLRAMLPYIVIYHASNKSHEKGKFTHNIPFELGYMEFFIKTLTGDSKLNMTTVSTALVRLLRDFLIGAASQDAEIYQFDVAERFDFIFVSYGYRYTAKEINGCYERAMIYLIKRFLTGHYLMGHFDRLDVDRFLLEVYHFMELVSDIPRPMLAALNDMINKIIVRDAEAIWKYPFWEDKLAAKKPDQKPSVLEAVIKGKMNQLAMNGEIIEDVVNAEVPPGRNSPNSMDSSIDAAATAAVVANGDVVTKTKPPQRRRVSIAGPNKAPTITKGSSNNGGGGDTGHGTPARKSDRSDESTAHDRNPSLSPLMEESSSD